ENELKIVKDINDRGIADLKDLYDHNKITVKEYYEFRQNLALDTLNVELAALEKEEAQIRQALAASKGPERIRDQQKLNDVLTKEFLVRQQINGVIEQAGREIVEADKLPDFVTGDTVQVVQQNTTVLQDYTKAIHATTEERLRLAESVKQSAIDDLLGKEK